MKKNKKAKKEKAAANRGKKKAAKDKARGEAQRLALVEDRKQRRFKRLFGRFK